MRLLNRDPPTQKHSRDTGTADARANLEVLVRISVFWWVLYLVGDASHGNKKWSEKKLK